MRIYLRWPRIWPLRPPPGAWTRGVRIDLRVAKVYLQTGWGKPR